MKYLIALLLTSLPLFAANPAVTYGSVSRNISPQNGNLTVATFTNTAATASTIALYDANKKLISATAGVDYANTAQKLSYFAATTSAEFFGVISDESGALGVVPRFSLTGAAQGDIVYFNGTSWVNLAPGVSGLFLQTQGAGANPTWAPGSGGDVFLANNQTFTGENYFTNTLFSDRAIFSLLWAVEGDPSDGANLLLNPEGNDYGMDAGVVRMTVSGSGSVGELTGIVVPDGFEHGNMTILVNVDLVDNILVRNQDARSIDTNRFYMSNDVLLRPNDSIFVRYDITRAGWRILDSQSSSANWFASGTTNSTLSGNAFVFSLTSTNSITNFGGLFVDGNSYFTNDVTVSGTFTGGIPTLDDNAGAVSLFNMSVTAGASGGTVESVTFPIDSNPMVVLYSQSNGAGAVTNRYVSMPDNDYIKTTAAGTAYQLTTTPAKVDLGTTDPTLTVTKTRTYRVKGAIYLEYNGATFAASQTVALKIRRTNNTAADIADSAWTIRLGVSTTLTAGVETIDIPECRYVGTAGDILEVWASVSVLPSVGSVDVTQAYIVAEPIE